MKKWMAIVPALLLMGCSSSWTPRPLSSDHPANPQAQVPTFEPLPNHLAEEASESLPEPVQPHEEDHPHDMDHPNTADHPHHTGGQS